MVRLATAKVRTASARVRHLVTVREGDAVDPGLAPASVDVVLSRHVLWALADPVAVVGRWAAALRPGGRLVLVEGSWSTGAGLTAQECVEIVREWCHGVEVRHLPDPRLWGGPVSDERYLARRPSLTQRLTYRAVTVTARKIRDVAEASAPRQDYRVVTGTAQNTRGPGERARGAVGVCACCSADHHVLLCSVTSRTGVLTVTTDPEEVPACACSASTPA